MSGSQFFPQLLPGGVTHVNDAVIQNIGGRGEDFAMTPGVVQVPQFDFDLRKLRSNIGDDTPCFPTSPAIIGNINIKPWHGPTFPYNHLKLTAGMLA